MTDNIMPSDWNETDMEVLRRYEENVKSGQERLRLLTRIATKLPFPMTTNGDQWTDKEDWTEWEDC